MRKSIIRKIIAVLVALSGTASFSLFAQAPGARGGCLVQSDGKGTLNLLWLPGGEEWPSGGWQIQNGGGKVLVARVAVGEEPFLSGLAPDKARGIRDLARGLPLFKDAEEKKNFFFGLRFAVLRDLAEARALGFSRTLDHVAPGPQAYRIVGLDAAGKPTGLVLKSPTVDAAIATPPPSRPGDFRAESKPEGVLLFWAPGPNQPEAPVFYYEVERTGASGERQSASRSPILLNAVAAPDRPSHVDSGAPVEQEITYSLYGVDVFGRRSPAVDFKVFHSDFSALVAPVEVKAGGGKGKVTLTWVPNPSPNTRQVFVERSLKADGNYVVLTQQGLSRTASSYEDTDVQGGVTYFYRLRSLGPQGTPGQPSVPVSASPGDASPPAPPTGLRAEVGRTRVRLTWDKGTAPVAVYILERRTAKSGWTRINPKLTQGTQYDDPLGDETGGIVAYRVLAITRDNQESAASKVLEVVVPERGLPPVPLVTGTATREGKAIVRFKPGLPEAKTTRFVVLRSGSPDQWGVVLGRPLPAEAREYVDPFVRAGESYWYRVVALNARGDRSEPTDAVEVAIGTPPIPQPLLPKLERIQKPFNQIKITFAPPPSGSGLMAVAERKVANESLWYRLPGGTADGELFDPAPPPTGQILYRVIFLAPNGVAGEPSPTAELAR
jgi:hypothetical protein